MTDNNTDNNTDITTTREVTGYVVDDKTPRPILGALCNAIFVEKGLA